MSYGNAPYRQQPSGHWYRDSYGKWRWAVGTSVNSYGPSPYGSPYGSASSGPGSPYGSPTPDHYPRVVPTTESAYAPPGLVLPLVLMTALSSRGTKAGDHISASLERNVPLQGNGYLPSGTVIQGHVVDSKSAGFMLHEGELGISWDSLKLPDGRQFPVSAHLLGGLGNVGDGNIPYSDVHGGEGWRQRAEQMGVSGAIGNVVEGGAGLGSFVEGGAGMGIWGHGNLYALGGLASGTTVMGLFNLAGGLLRRGHNIIVPSGSQFQIRLDSGLTIPNQPAQGEGGGGF
jgi:hypothetical protein